MFIPESILLPIVNNKSNLCINNKKNVKIIKNFLEKIYKPIRFEYLWNIIELTTFVKIIKYFDLPFFFDLKKKKLWRFYGLPYGAFFDKKIRSYVLYFSTGFKKNIGVSIQFFVNFPSKSNLYSPIDWHKFSFLFKKTLINFKYIKLFLNKNYNPKHNLYLNLIPIHFYILNYNFHRCLNLSDIDVNPWVTTFDYRFWTHDIYDLKYKISNLSKIDYFWGVHEQCISSSFFVTSFDTRIILYPELYFKYISEKYNIFNYFKILKYYNKKYYISFYYNILKLFENIYNKKINNIFVDNFFINNRKMLKNFKLFLFNEKFIIKEKYIKFFFLFNKILNIKNIFLNIYMNLYIFKSNFLIKKILLKNYYYYRSRKYNKESPLKLNYRFNFIKKLPRINKYMKYYAKYFTQIYYKKLYRVIFYNKFSKLFYVRIKKFWNYFFLFFISNIKNKFHFSNIYTNKFNIIYIDYIFDLLLFLKKYFLFNLFLRKYYNKFFYLKKFKYK